MNDTMNLRLLPDRSSYRRMTTNELRDAFLIGNLFAEDSISMTYCDADRAIIGGVVPRKGRVELKATKKEMAAEYFHERRETGIANVGGRGSVAVDGSTFDLGTRDMLYVGRGAKKVEFASADRAAPAAFYFVSFPAHAANPTTLKRYAEAEKNPIGTPEGASRRTIHKYIHPGGVKSCQLVMGLTELETGCVWNTMPPHTHQRRMEVYFYFGLDPQGLVVHLMGTPEETRNLIVREREAVISPAWSIHCGAATGKYSFIWAMGGENQDFADMDQVPPTLLY